MRSEIKKIFDDIRLEAIEDLLILQFNDKKISAEDAAHYLNIKKRAFLKLVKRYNDLI